MNCSNCGTPFSPGDTVCSKCGLQLSAPIQGAYQQPANKKIPVWAWVLGGCSCGGCLPVVILAAILFPVFVAARERARQEACSSNEKQMALALTQYAQDNDSRLPPAASWLDAAYPYIKANLRCPDNASVSSSGYAYYIKLDKANISKIANPAFVPSIYDSTSTDRNATDALTSIPTPGRHRDGNNYAFVDGHVQWSNTPPSP